MVSAFRRSLSLPKPKPGPVREKSYHVRSVSLPNRPHPLIALLKDQIQALKSWKSAPDRFTSGWVLTGLAQLKVLHESLDDFLNQPQSRSALRRRPNRVESLLDHLLRFADAYGIFRAALVAFNEDLQAAQVAIRSRRADRDSRLADAYLKSRKRLKNELAPIHAALRRISKENVPVVSVEEEESEVEEIVREASLVTVAVSVAVFGGVSGCDGTRSFIGLKRTKTVDTIREFESACGEEIRRLTKRGEEKTALRRLEALEDCAVGIERESERVLRSLIVSRVSLLNLLQE